MEATLLAGVLQSDTHKRLAVAEELLEWTQKEENDPLTFPELDRLVGGLAGWMSSSNFKVGVWARARERREVGGKMSVII